MNSILKSADGKDLILTCTCGCEDAIHFRIDTSDPDYYFCMSYTSGNWYRDQDDTAWRIFRKKLKKIWRIIRNKDHHYSDIHMTPADFDLFREYVNSVGVEKTITEADLLREKLKESEKLREEAYHVIGQLIDKPNAFEEE